MSITISSSICPNATRLDAAVTAHRSKRPMSAPLSRGVSSERDSFALIGALKQAVDGKAIRESRLSRGERYAALTHTALAQRSPRLAADFALRLENGVANAPKQNLGNRFLRATDGAIRELVREGYLTQAEARAVRSEALRATESRRNDGNRALTALGSGHSGPSAISPAVTPSDKGPTTFVDAPSGFLWKPFSDSDGLLAVLLPVEWTADVTSVEIVSPDGEGVLATGRPTGIGNGGRAHFRFDRTGGDFPAGSIVRVYRGDGSVVAIAIPQPGIRNEGTRS